MIACASCGQENPDSARFCNACGSKLEGAPPGAREERKVVTVLFADLVGFTSLAEHMDPEDVREMLRGYHGRLQQELERFGGTVEKFIGDAVMAAFGAPTSHEDDPERAVRAALAICDWVNDEQGDDRPLQVRLGIYTGEALVSLGALAARGEAMVAGDAVNTAARIQAAAPVNGILVGETVYRATKNAIEYQEADPVVAKGKTEPIGVWRAVGARARVGVERQGGAALVGRERELALLSGALDRAKGERQPQLVTLVGEPGIGKSRLVFELFKAIERGGELVYWRRGRSLPYGEGVTYWALGEMVKAQAGILEGDPGDVAERNLRAAVTDLFDDATEMGWVEAQLRPLVGIAEDDAREGSREEAFAAWRRFFEAMAERRPLVMVFEDLHWADDALLDFVDELVEWASNAPLLIVVTARPELFTRRPGWGGGKANAVTISLSPLSVEDTARLVHALLGRSAVPAEAQSALLERAGGNPLYAEEFIALLQERGIDAEGGVALPESVQGILAARLDGLAPEQKALVHDAAVLGRVFWTGALASMAGLDRREVEQRLHALERRELIRRERRASVADESEYAFRHLLVRDAAYAQIPRRQRAERHRLAAEWIESLGRPEDHAELVAHHYLSAFQYARASGVEEEPLARSARAALRAAGDRALSLTAGAASARFYDASLGLTPEDDPTRPRLLLSLAQALHASGQEATPTLEEAVQALVDAGDLEGAAVAECVLAQRSWRAADRDLTDRHLDRAVHLTQGLPPSPAVAHVLGEVSRYHMLGGRADDAIATGQEALSIAERFGLEEVRASALDSIGSARTNSGYNADGIEEIRRSIEIATAAHAVDEALRAYNNLGACLMALGRLGDAIEAWRPGLELAERHRGLPGGEWLRRQNATAAYATGQWDELQRWKNEFLGNDTLGYTVAFVREMWARVRLARGDVAGALRDTSEALESSRRAKDPQRLHPSLTSRAFALHAAGQLLECSAIIDELLLLDPLRLAASHVVGTPLDLAWTMTALGRGDEFVTTAAGAPSSSWWVEAGLAYARGRIEESVEVCGRIGALPSEAYSRILAGERLLAEGRREAAEGQLSRALVFYRTVGASAYITRAEALLAGAEVPDAATQ